VLHHRLGSLSTEHADPTRIELEEPSPARREAEPTGAEHAEQMAMGEYERCVSPQLVISS